MAARERRHELLERLEGADAPLSGGRLAGELGVSRQVIVGDIGYLRAAGHDIVSTARGYVLSQKAAAPEGGAGRSADKTASEQPPAATSSISGQVTRIIKVRHTVEETSDELLCILENGGAVIDVSVSHRAYGKIAAPLNIFTRADALRFIDAITTGKSSPLLTVTSGYHYHTIAAGSEATLNRIERALDAKGYLAPFLPHELAS